MTKQEIEITIRLFFTCDEGLFIVPKITGQMKPGTTAEAITNFVEMTEEHYSKMAVCIPNLTNVRPMTPDEIKQYIADETAEEYPQERPN